MYKLALLSVILSLTFLSCSDNSTNSDDLEDGEGVGSFTVSGDVEAEYEAVSYFTVIRNDGNLLSIRIHMVESHPLDRDDSYDPEYSFVLMSDLGGDPISLSTGSYDIGTLSDEELMFAGVYTHRISADVVNGYQYQNGTITITSYSDNLIEASFELTAENNNSENATGAQDGGIITISGEFSAGCFGVNC